MSDTTEAAREAREKVLGVDDDAVARVAGDLIDQLAGITVWLKRKGLWAECQHDLLTWQEKPHESQ